jgi:aryl-alcohol dehydrogenase-like predicted oxidoreductase
MQYRTLGNSGLRVSAIGLGANNFGRVIDEAQSIAVIQQALEVGINHIDTADFYGLGTSETFIGKAIRGRRDQVVIATKFGQPMGDGPNDRGLARAHMLRAVEASLRRLGTDYIDVYIAHVPDPVPPVEETLRAFDDLVRQGKVRYVGCSNYPAWRIAELACVARAHGYAPPVAALWEYNLLERRAEAEVLPCCQRFGIGLVPFFPLASGLLTGKYRPGEPPPPGSRATLDLPYAPKLASDKLALVARLDDWARSHGHTVLELALAWLLARPAVASVIAGATKPEQVVANAAAADWQLTPAQLQEIDALLQGTS